jgi:hypothetical protein
MNERSTTIIPDANVYRPHQEQPVETIEEHMARVTREAEAAARKQSTNPLKDNTQ